MGINEQIKEILEEELVTALGCTEPIAVALCSAIARSYTKGDIVDIYCEASINIVKNAAAVVIPETGGRCGVALASALGAVCGDSTQGLEVISMVTPPTLDEALELCESKKCRATIAMIKRPLYIKTTLKTTEDTVVAIIADTHTNLVYLEKNGQVLLDKEHDEVKHAGPPYGVLSLGVIWDFALHAPMEELALIEKAIALNSRLSEEGLKRGYGLQVGRTIAENIEKGVYQKDLCSNAMMYTAAATDARMAGCSYPAMSNSGSGNQGITCTMPVVATAKYLGKDYETMVRATAISNLCTIFIKSHLQRLSAVCGAIGAATGAGCGIVYLLGGGTKEMSAVICNVLGDLAGMFCDGAKGSCGLKVSSAVNAAVQAAVLAMNGLSIGYTEGIVGHTETDTLENYAKLSSEGMCLIDGVIMDIILKK